MVTGVNDDSDIESRRKAAVKTAAVLGFIAIAVYVGFILSHF